MSEILQHNDDVLLQTKLHRPGFSGDYLSRPRLHGILDQVLNTPLTLVSAPAGYGKSRLLSHWVESQDVPCAWLSLDDSDSDVGVFIDYLLAAVESAIPGVCPLARQMAQSPDPLSRPALARSLTNELDAHEAPLVVVLDDYHRIQVKSEVQVLLRDLLSHPPRSLHLVILTRHDPPFGLNRSRAEGDLTEIRLQDLRFSAMETSSLLNRVLGYTISEEALSNLQQEIEGWAAGLRLVLLALHGVEDYNGFLEKLHGGIQLTQGYLLQEVIAGQTSVVCDWLLRTSILERMCAGLCSAVALTNSEAETGEISGTEFVQRLLEYNLFTIALDKQGIWFRYHHLFQEMLQTMLAERMEPAEILELHQRASRWFEKQSMIEEAIRYALKAQDTYGAAEIFERHRHFEQDQDRWRNVEKWLAAFPPEIKLQRPGLLLGQAWVLHDRYQLGGIAPITERLELFAKRKALDGESLGELRFFQGMLQFWAGNWNISLKRCKEARNLISDKHPRITGLVEIYLALASYTVGRVDETLMTLNDRIKDGSLMTGAFLSRLEIARSFLYMLSGDLSQATQDAVSVAELARQGSMAYMEGWGGYLEGAGHFQRNEPKAAQACFKPLFDHRYSIHTRAGVDAMVVLALTYETLQQTDLATETIEGLQNFIHDAKDSQHLPVVKSGYARLALARGDIETARRWLRSFDEQPFGPAMFIWLEVPSVTQARVLLAMASDQSLQQASELLAELRNEAEDQHNVYQLIDLLVLQSLVFEKLGRDDEALTVMGQALSLAEPGGWVRPFIEPGHDMVALLKRLRDNVQDPTYIDRLLCTFKGQSPPGAAVTPAEENLDNITLGLGLSEPLTPREQQILELLTGRLRDKEIATRLFISPQTVNFHLKNIYHKLGVNNRREAAAKALGR